MVCKKKGSKKKALSAISPVMLFSPECVVVEVLGAAVVVDDMSKCRASSVSALTLLRWMASVRKSIEKNRKPS